ERLLERVEVRPLLAEGTAALLAERLDQREAPAELAALLHARAEGNPFFTRELLEALIERGGGFLGHAGRWDRLAIAEIEIPHGIRLVLGQRVAHLAPAAQEALRAASVLGQAFAFDDLLGMGGPGEADLEAALEEAVAAGLAHEAGGDGYVFHHALVQR